MTSENINVVNQANTVRGLASTEARHFILNSRPNNRRRVYVYDLNGRRQNSEEFNYREIAQNNAEGITATNNRIFLLDRVNNKIFSYTHAGANQSSEIVTLATENKEGQGLTSSNTELFVIDSAPADFVYNYTLPVLPTSGTMIPFNLGGTEHTAKHLYGVEQKKFYFLSNVIFENTSS